MESVEFYKTPEGDVMYKQLGKPVVVSSEVRVALLFCQFLVGKSSLFFLFLFFQGIYQ